MIKMSVGIFGHAAAAASSPRARGAHPGWPGLGLLPGRCCVFHPHLPFLQSPSPHAFHPHHPAAAADG